MGTSSSFKVSVAYPSRVEGDDYLNLKIYPGGTCQDNGNTQNPV